MIVYLIESAIIWAILLLAYRVFFVRETFFQLNRFFLITTILAGLLFPLLNINVIESARPLDLDLLFNELVFTAANTPTMSEGSSTLRELSFSWQNLAWIIYLAGMLFFAYRFLLGIVQLLKFYQRAEKQIGNDHVLLMHDEIQSPFSFFNWLFSKREMIEKVDWPAVLKHELVHIRQWHSLDILLVELCKVIFWFNPIIWLFGKEMAQNHEFLADREGAALSGKKNYSQLLLSLNQNTAGNIPANHFNYSPLKNRIKMIYRKESKKNMQAKYILMLPIFFALFFIFSCDSEKMDLTTSSDLSVEQTKQSDQQNKAMEDEIYTVVEEMPRFPGCEGISESREELNKCSQNELFGFIYNNLKYPEEARQNGTEGMVVAEFVVFENGSIQDIQIVKEIGDGCGDEVRRVLEAMNEMDDNWIPGKMKGKEVKVKYTLPVKFKLS